MRLGFHYHVPACLREGNLWMPAYQGRFVDALASECSEVVCFLHTPAGHEETGMDYAVHSSNVRMVNLGPHASVPHRMLRSRECAKTVNLESENLDILLLRGPSPLLPALARASNRLPIALLLVGDAVTSSSDSGQPIWRRLATSVFWRWNRKLQEQIARRSLTFVNSRKLYNELRATVRDLIEIRTTTLTKADVFVRDNTCAHPPYHLLYTGRMARAKGLIELVKGIPDLVRTGNDVVLDLVGWPEKGDDVMDEIAQLSRKLKIENRILFHGPKPVGPDLFSFYKKADLFVIASKSEGFPRAIWEAMAHSLPVVATKVGSIPHLTAGAAFLVQPNDQSALTQGIREMLGNATRRSEMIKKGRELASRVTLEEVVKSMVSGLKEWLAQRP